MRIEIEIHTAEQYRAFSQFLTTLAGIPGPASWADMGAAVGSQEAQYQEAKRRHIAPEDRPDAGVSYQSIGSVIGAGKLLDDSDGKLVVNMPNPYRFQPPAPDAAAVFGAAMQAPLNDAVDALLTSPFVPSTAVVPPPPIVPGVSTATAALPVQGANFNVPVFGQLAVAPPAPTQPPAKIELDSQGLPWDVRINATNRSRNQDGTWRARRGMNDEAKVNGVKAELRAMLAIPAPPAPPAAQPTQIKAPTNYPELTLALTQRMHPHGPLAVPFVIAKAKELGLNGLPDFQTRPDLIPAFWSSLSQ